MQSHVTYCAAAVLAAGACAPNQHEEKEALCTRQAVPPRGTAAAAQQAPYSTAGRAAG
jgi:hypothetical protein